jgi:hypothetical protein
MQNLELLGVTQIGILKIRYGVNVGIANPTLIPFYTHNKMYDNICKFIAEMFSEDLSDWLIGKPISLTELKPKDLSLEPIRADSIIFLQSPKLILHLEFAMNLM